MIKRTLLFLTIVCLTTTAYAQKRPFTIDDVYRIKSISDVHVSPDGRSLLYAVTTSDLPRAKRLSHVWIMGIDGKNARELTSGDASESSPAFSPDGKWISYLSSKDGTSEIYVMPATGGEAKKL